MTIKINGFATTLLEALIKLRKNLHANCACYYLLHSIKIAVIHGLFRQFLSSTIEILHGFDTGEKQNFRVRT
jgi:hypothetical protein